jgi:hypothetical protein
LPLALADDAGVGHGASVGAGERTGQGEARDVIATRQTWK